jgi:hypothetical protein
MINVPSPILVVKVEGRYRSVPQRWRLPSSDLANVASLEVRGRLDRARARSTKAQLQSLRRRNSRTTLHERQQRNDARDARRILRGECA